MADYVYYSIVLRDANPYELANTTDAFNFTISKRIPSRGNVTITWSLNGTTVQVFSGQMSANRDFAISNTDLLNALNNTGQGTMTITTVCTQETNSATVVVNVNPTVFKTQFTANPTVAIQSTPIRGYLISGYSTARVSYSATKGTGASQMLFDFSVAYGISGSFDPSSYATSRASYNGHTDLTISRRDTGIDFISNIQVTDSRGQSTDRRTVSTAWQGYTLPEITVEAFRCNAQGNRDDSGDHVSIMFSGTYSLTGIGNVGHVSLTVGSQTYTDPTQPIILSQAQNVAKTYTIIATDTVTNFASETVRKPVTVNMAKFPLDLYDDGQGHLGARVGAIAEPDYFTCGLKPKGIFFYGTCGTARATARKVVSDVDQTFQLYEGVLVFIKFTNANGKANPTLNINGTGAHAIRRYGTTAPSTSRASSWNAGSVVAFIYDGTQYQMVGWINTTYSVISQANIETLRGTSSGLITGQRFTQGFDARFSSAFTSALTKSAIYSVLGANTEKTVHLGGMSAYSTARNKLRINIPIPTGATISVAIDSGYTSWQIASSSANQTVTVSSVSVIDNDISSATIEVTLSTNALTSDRAYNFKNGQIKMTIS